MKVHHIGYLVDDVEKAAVVFEKLGYIRDGETVEDFSREVYILFLVNAAQTVELIQPVNEKSPIYGLRKRYRNSPYHICFETGNLQSEIDDMIKHNGYTLVQPPQPAPAIEGASDVAFLIHKDIGMLELVEIKE